MNPEKKDLPEETVDEQTAANSVFGAVEKYNADYNEILNQQDEYLLNSYNQQKQKAEQAYTQEKSAAYADYQKQVDPYGVQAEQMAQSGLTGSGYAESLKTQAYVAYQNRQAVAYQSYQDAVVSFNNAFNEAKMQNDSQRAALAFQTYQMQLEAVVSMLTSGNADIMKQAGDIIKNANGDWDSVYNQMIGEENGNSETPVAANGTIYNDKESAKAALKAKGINAPILPQWMWEMGHRTAAPVSAYQDYDSYSEYLTAMVNKHN